MYKLLRYMHKLCRQDQCFTDAFSIYYGIICVCLLVEVYDTFSQSSAMQMLSVIILL